jgi:NAD(P)H-hydrate epimerase
VTLLEPSALATAFPARDPRAHKGRAGRVVIVGGAAGMTGAAVLAATAAVRSGAGYVRVCAPASVQDVLASHLVEPMVVACGEDSQRALGTSAEGRIRDELARADVLAVGPGLSRRPQALELARRLLSGLARPAVVDADALFALSPAAEHLPAALGAAAGPRVLTPHLLELERLTGVPGAELESRRMDAAAEWAARWGCLVVLKGAPTVVAASDGRVAVNPTGNPGMATAGMGDVLTGCIAALLAQGLPAYEAACLAVFAHGLAGDRIAAEQGATGLSAGDVASALPRSLQVVRESH